MITYPITHIGASEECTAATSLRMAELKLWNDALSTQRSWAVGDGASIHLHFKAQRKQCRDGPSPFHHPGWGGLGGPLLVSVHSKLKCR